MRGGLCRTTRTVRWTEPDLDQIALSSQSPDRADIDLIADEAGRKSEDTQDPNVRARLLRSENGIAKVKKNK